jgi:hypothetical protein
VFRNTFLELLSLLLDLRNLYLILHVLVSIDLILYFLLKLFFNRVIGQVEFEQCEVVVQSVCKVKSSLQHELGVRKVERL